MKPKIDRNVGNNGTGKTCPEQETLRFFVERILDPVGMVAVAQHLKICASCREEAKDHAMWIAAGLEIDVADATEEERALVCNILRRDSSVAIADLWRDILEKISPSHEYLAAADGQTADQLQQTNADLSGFFHFASKGGSGHKNAWYARLAIPAVVTDMTLLRFQIYDFQDSNRSPIESGVLNFCGIDLKVQDGYATISLKTFRENVGVALIALRREGGETVPGEPIRVFEMGI
ncbi:MAG: hypothetical protein IJU44_02670 [Kiritimatiellae bacterium]|nr:hypothetical protein [Kiritimatiellia bacterium]